MLLIGPSNCSSSQWQCDSKQCIQSAWHCDNDTDCHDGSDERNCSLVKRPAGGDVGRNCTVTEFQCHSSGDCIHKAWLCDGDDDCADASDEIGCEYQIAVCLLFHYTMGVECLLGSFWL